LVVHFARHFRFALSRHHAAARAAADWGALHERAGYFEGDSLLVSRRAAGGIREDQDEQEPTQAVSSEDCGAHVFGPGLRLREFLGDCLPGTAGIGDRGTRGALLGAEAVGHPPSFAGRCGRILRHRDQRMARANRGSGDVADGPPDEREAVGDVRAVFRAAAA
jgi:hypothetical protein